MSSDPDKHVTGDLGEGVGIRDDTVMKEVENDLDQAINQPPTEKEKPLIIIGKHSQIRCHRCSTSKGSEDKGVWQQVNAFIVWFHDKECCDLWNKDRTGFRTGALIDEYGNQLDEFGNQL